MSAPRWVVVDVDVRGEDAALARSAVGDADVAYVTLWWGPVPVGRLVLRVEQLPVSDAFVRHRFADLAAPVVLAREAPGGRARPGTDGEPAPPRLVRPGHTGDGSAHLDALLLGADLDAGSDPDARDGLPEVAWVVCTRGRGADIGAALTASRAQIVAPSEIIVVDNNDEPDAALAELVASTPSARVVHEPRPGLSRARNAGIRATRASVVAFTDDDAVPTPEWTRAVATVFTDESIDAATGVVLPAALDTPAAVHFQLARGGLGGSFVPLVFDRDFFEAARPEGVPVWRIGSGANLAVRRTAFELLGGFDERLGAGASGCSEDSELLFRMLDAGCTVVNEPRLVVRHRHRSTLVELARQIHAYQRGHVSALVAQADRHADDGSRRRALRELPRYYAVMARWHLTHPSRRGPLLYLAELSGYLRGLGYFARRQWRTDSEPPTVAFLAEDHG